jgi:TPR repeat protein
LLKGHGDEQDQIRTRTWFEQAAASGDLIAAFNFGVCLAEGVGIERDDRKAAEWLRRAADGVINAQYWYGRMLVEGRGVDVNPEEGRLWIAKAADIGMVEAEVMLADMMLSGRGGPKAMSARCSRSARCTAAATTCHGTVPLRSAGSARRQSAGIPTRR